MLVESSTEAMAPRRAKLRAEKEEPMEKQSSTEAAPPKAIFPREERDDPNRTKLRTDRLLWVFVLSRALAE
jgi:hypothetical protein